MSINKLRKAYHELICRDAIRVKKGKKGEYPNFADGDNKSSREIAWSIVKELGYSLNYSLLKEQTIGDIFEDATKEFLENSFSLLAHLRPGKWHYSTDKTSISGFVQYMHLAELDKKAKLDKTLASVLGVGYIVKPDIVVGRYPVSDAEINKNAIVLEGGVSESTPLRNKNQETMLLHASISCKWTIRSDRSQNARTEALNLIRNRKGNLPHIVAVTAEPLPTRLATLALGTGDIDCVYHFALPELKAAIEKTGNEDQMDMLISIIEGDRLRDISDLPFDLAA
jgi:hypothetical protein